METGITALMLEVLFQCALLFLLAACFIGVLHIIIFVV